MKIIIQMTEQEFDNIMDDKQFSNRKELADYISNTYNGGQDCDIIEICDPSCVVRYSVYVKGDDNLGR